VPCVVTVVIPACVIRASGTANVGWGLPSSLGLLPPLLGGALVGLGVLLIYKTVSLFVTVGDGTLAPWDPTATCATR
jgi:hypothetical protein